MTQLDLLTHQNSPNQSEEEQELMYEYSLFSGVAATAMQAIRDVARDEYAPNSYDLDKIAAYASGLARAKYYRVDNLLVLSGKEHEILSQER